MARSRKKTPKSGMTFARSENTEKAANHRRERRRIHQVLATKPENDILPHTKELSNRWRMSKDGKVFLGERAEEKDLRK